MDHVQVVEGLVQEHVGSLLGQHHGDEGPLALPTGHLVEVAVGQLCQVHPLQGLVDDRLIVLGGTSPVVRIAAESHEVTHSQSHGEMVVLLEDGQNGGELAPRGGGDVQTTDFHRAGVGSQESGDHGQQRGLTGPVGTNQSDDSAGRQVEVDVGEHLTLTVGLGKATNCDHERLLELMRRAMRVSPPRNSMMTDRTLSASRT